jgi:hypothetical protein
MRLTPVEEETIHTFCYRIEKGQRVHKALSAEIVEILQRVLNASPAGPRPRKELEHQTIYNRVRSTMEFSGEAVGEPGPSIGYEEAIRRVSKTMNVPYERVKKIYTQQRKKQDDWNVAPDDD